VPLVVAYLLVLDHLLLQAVTLLPDERQGHPDAPLILPSLNGPTLQVGGRL
jgi:DNA polymerase II large subunit